MFLFLMPHYMLCVLPQLGFVFCPVKWIGEGVVLLGYVFVLEERLVIQDRCVY